jgi:Fe-S cluster assembly protein SufD
MKFQLRNSTTMSLTATDKNISSNIASQIQSRLNSGLTDLRADAFTTFQKLGLPSNKNEEYKHTPITRELEKTFVFGNPVAAPTKTGIDSFLIPNIEANVLVFINGVFSKENSTIISPASEVTIQNLEDVIATNNQFVVQHLGKLADFKADAFTAWNTAAWTSGVFIHVPKNKVVEKPIIIYHISDSSNGEVATIQRNLIVVEQSAEVTVIEKFDTVDGSPVFSNLVTEVAVDENAGFNLYSIQNDAGKRFQFGQTTIHQENSSRVNTFTFTLNGKVVRNNLQLILDGEGIESHMYGLYLIGGDTLADNHTVVDHKKPNSFSNELYKGVMDGTSRGVFNGKIYVRPQAQKTNAFQSNRNVLLSDKATVNTKPQLEIWADDVKCSHGCTSGQLDEEALFYLRSRGISKETAQAMMLYAFAGEVLENVKHPVLKEYLDNLISERLHKNF